MSKEQTETSFNLEKAVKDLEGIVSYMEKDVLSIESALAEFEKGVHLIKRCQDALKEAEQKVSILTEKNDEGQLEPYSIEQISSE
jgi:exodeoxyribonuclease VII small subunit